jgi:hypothetical protein
MVQAFPLENFKIEHSEGVELLLCRPGDRLIISDSRNNRRELEVLQVYYNQFPYPIAAKIHASLYRNEERPNTSWDYALIYVRAQNRIAQIDLCIKDSRKEESDSLSFHSSLEFDLID